MSLIWGAVYYLMWAEIAMVVLISIPFPNRIRRPIIKAVAGNPQLHRAVQIVGAAVTLLFLDAYTRAARLRERRNAPLLDDAEATVGTLFGGLNDADRFRAERNMYICGMTMILALVLHVIQGLVVSLGDLEIQHDVLKRQAENAQRGQAALDELNRDEKEGREAELLVTINNLRRRVVAAGGDLGEDGGDAAGDEKKAGRSVGKEPQASASAADLAKLEKELAKAKADVEAMRARAEGQGQEVESLRDENDRLRSQLSASDSKKDK